VCSPCYYITWLFGAVFIWLGCWIHTPFGQGGKTRADETLLEGCVRKQWIYMCDGLYGLMLFLDMTDFFQEWASAGIVWETDDGTCGAMCYLIAAGIYFILMCGNFIFVNAMQHKMEVRLRSCIIGNLTFGTLVLIALLASAISGKGTTHGNSFLQGFVWVFRTGVVACYVAIGLYYTQLWNVYHRDAVEGDMRSKLWWDIDGDGVEDDCQTHLEHCTFCRAMGPSLCCIAVSLWLFMYHPDSVWSALAA
jgi:hypothetical protein